MVAFSPLHVLLYRYLGWERQNTKVCHLPLILKPDGNGKLSKRDGDRLGFPVFPTEWTNPKLEILVQDIEKVDIYQMLLLICWFFWLESRNSNKNCFQWMNYVIILA